MVVANPFEEVPLNAGEKNNVLAVWGTEKMGKTHFMFTAAEHLDVPLWLVNMDYGWHEPRKKFPGVKLYKVDHFIPMGDFNPEACEVVLDKVEESWEIALEAANRNGGVVGLDTGTQHWELTQLVELTGQKHKRLRSLQRRQPGATEDDLKNSRLDYGPANARAAGFYRKACTYDNVTTILLHRAKENYNDKGEALGTFKMAGFKEVPAIVSATIQLFKKADGTLMYRFQSCRADTVLEGQSFPSPSFENVKEMMS